MITEVELIKMGMKPDDVVGVMEYLHMINFLKKALRRDRKLRFEAGCDEGIKI